MSLAQNFADSLADAAQYDWHAHARSEQLAPEGTWRTWLILAGRGFGKTRSGAEWIRDGVCGSTPLSPGRFKRIGLVAETAADAREVMVGDGRGPGEGSGLLQVHPKDFMPVYEPSKRRVTWPNGAIATLFNGTEPDALRGPEHDAVWCDELAKFMYGQESWDQIQFGLRIGPRPQCVVTTTPRPLPLIKGIMRDPTTIVTRGRTKDNAQNLAPSYLAYLKNKYEGTRLGRQELEAELLEDVVGALWQRKWIDDARVAHEPPDLRRIVVAVDPSVSTSEKADECGIVVAGLGKDGHAYVLADLTERLSPRDWARKAIKAYHTYEADKIIAETNNGGMLVENTIRMVDPSVAYREVKASRGKAIRAEPVAALYEQGKVHHVGSLSDLEDQQCAFTADFDRRRAGYSPDRVDALVWALSELMVRSKAPEGGSYYHWEGRLYRCGTGPAYGERAYDEQLLNDPPEWFVRREAEREIGAARSQAIRLIPECNPKDEDVIATAQMLVRDGRIPSKYIKLLEAKTAAPVPYTSRAARI